MLFFYYGKNSYSLSEKKRAVFKEAYEQKANLTLFDAEKSLDFQKISQEIAGSDLFSSSKFLVFSEIISTPALNSSARKLKDFLADLKKSQAEIFSDSATKVYFFETNPTRKHPLFAFLKKQAEIEEFKELKGAQLEEFLQQEAERLKINIDASTIRHLCQALNYQVWPAVNELKRLAAYKPGEQITRAEVDALVTSEFSKDIFKTIDALGRGDKRTAINLLKTHLKAGDDPFYLLSMVVYQFRNLLKVRDALEKQLPPAQIAQKLKLHPFVVQKSIGFSRRFQLAQLKKLYAKLAEMDASIKNGSIDAVSALDLFVAFS